MNDALEQFISKNSNRAKEYRKIIESMMGDYAHYNYAESTLLGILEYIEKNDTVTNAQIQAIENIKSKPNERFY